MPQPFPRTSSINASWWPVQQDPEKDLGRIDAAYQKAKGYLATSQLSDLEFTETMSTISLACMRLADQELVDRVVLSEYPEQMETTSGDDPAVEQNGKDETDGKEGESEAKKPAEDGEEDSEKPARTRGILLARLEQIQAVIQANTVPVEVSKIKVIDKTVRGAQDPSKNKKSLL